MNWNEFLKNEAEKQYFIKIKEKLKEKHLNGIVIYPPQEQIFNAFNLTPFDKVKVIILGQDPYHGSGQAMGLSFSVPDDKPIPPSLKNIFKEIEDDLQIKCLKSGDLTRWAEQGVFLLNTSLTASALKELNNDNSPKVFILWGNNAKRLKFILTNPAHLILESAHPSPLSAYRGFFGNKHFSQTNQFLIEHKLSPIDWR